ncbi:hypothetical protein HBI55_245940 [Parastagonospora nodorum]|nr:hypothetical protein HBI28_216010 [Parastagonospora nodorum]KAH5618629.1 hypothetical protein HBI22_233360 [Parastagonospora nodorum]KAH6084446.1 hypothetical protein HBI66_052090 [Parastagonospora nodorum]KAH6086613.1 hypothetical protein HBI67_016260 [Parastagonospora nodorum]KAH6481210.1 hypothetical protein HBI55_245940 [Parastagonospora nodorum]
MALPHEFYIISICSVLTFFSSIACIASKSTASHSYNEARYGGSGETPIVLAAEFPNERIALAPYPYYLGLDATTLVLVASGIALVTSIGFVGLSAFVMLKRHPVKLSWYWKQAVLVVLFANASLALAALVTNFIFHSKSERFSLAYRSLNGGFGYGDVYEFGVFDLETWTCEIKNLPSFREVSTLSQQCTAETSARACTVAIFIFALCMFIGTWWDTKTHQAMFVVAWKMDRMAFDDDDDCELDDITATSSLAHNRIRAAYL